MTNSSDLLDNIVTSLQAIPALVTLLGASTAIDQYRTAWPNDADVRLAIWRMKPPGIRAHYRGTRAGRFGNIPSRVHYFSLFVRAGAGPQDALSIWDLVINGVPTSGGGLPWRYVPIHDNCDMVDAPEMQPRTLVVTSGGEETVLDYHEITFGLTEKGDY
jgi:hypothetical protein